MGSAIFGQTRPNGSPRININPAPRQPFDLYDPQRTIEEESPSLRERINDILLPDEDTIPDVSQIDMGNDPCCDNAREMWYGLLGQSGITRDDGSDILNGYDEMDCEEFEAALRDFAGDMPGKYYKNNVTDRARFSGGYLPPTEFHHYARQVLDAWDGCKFEGQNTPEAQDMGFYASDDPFEAGWRAILKYSVYDDPPDDAPVEGLVTTHSGIGAPEVAAKRVGTKPLLSMDGWDQSIRTLDANHDGKHTQQWFSPDTLDDTLGQIHDATTNADSWAFHGSPSCAKIAGSNLHGKTDPHGAMGGMRFVGDVMDNIREWENPPSMMTVEQSKDIIPHMLDSRRGANRGISEDFKTMVRNNPLLTSSMFGSPTTRRRMWAAEGTKATPTHTKDQFRSINDLFPDLAQEWQDSDIRDGELEHLRQSGRIGSKQMDWMSEAPFLGLLGSINPGKNRAVWNDDHKAMAFKHLSRLDKPIPGIRHHGASLGHTRHLTPEEMLQIQGWTPEEAKAFNFPQRPNETYDVNAGTGKKKNPNNVIRTQIGNTLSPNIYENMLRNVGLGQQRLF